MRKFIINSGCDFTDLNPEYPVENTLFSIKNNSSFPFCATKEGDTAQVSPLQEEGGKTILLYILGGKRRNHISVRNLSSPLLCLYYTTYLAKSQDFLKNNFNKLKTYLRKSRKQSQIQVNQSMLHLLSKAIEIISFLFYGA